jgi:peroxiredoxin
LGSVASAQGILPAPSTSTTTIVSIDKPILIGEALPDTLIVTDASGTVRTLLSYKSPVDVLVIGFFSTRCPTDAALQVDLRRFYEAYKGWRVAFVGVSSNSGETVADAGRALANAKLPFPAVRDEGAKVARALKVQATPTILIVDESGVLRYRGPLHDAGETPGRRPKIHYAKEAIEAVIGHIQGVTYAEPTAFVGCPIQ